MKSYQIVVVHSLPPNTVAKLCRKIHFCDQTTTLIRIWSRGSAPGIITQRDRIGLTRRRSAFKFHHEMMVTESHKNEVGGQKDPVRRMVVVTKEQDAAGVGQWTIRSFVHYPLIRCPSISSRCHTCRAVLPLFHSATTNELILLYPMTKKPKR